MSPMRPVRVGSEAARVRSRMEKELLELPGVVGVSHSNASEKIRIYVESEADVPAMPTALADVPVEVRVIGRVVALAAGQALSQALSQGLREVSVYRLSSILAARTDRWRPAPGGVSIGHPRITAGTLGVLTGDGYILSNNHVLAATNQGVPGDPVLQPGPYDGGRDPDDRIGSLESFVRIDFEETNYIDAAIATADDPSLVSREIVGVGRIWGWTDAVEGQHVWKSGRTTGLTSSYVTDVNATVKVAYESRVAVFSDCVFVDSSQWRFGAGGDSGSLIFTKVAGLPHAVGLLFAGSDRVIAGCKISRVIEELKIDMGPYREWSFPGLLGAIPGFLPIGLVGGIVAVQSAGKW